MKKVFVAFVLSLAAFAFAALAFVNNVAVIINWWDAFLAAGGDGAKIPAKMPGIIPWLDWSAVDYSAVSTLIPMVGFLSMTIAAFKILCRRRISVMDFPFFKGSDQLNIALGLFGTLWGIIVIGYYNLETVSMPDLMQCLHTALFSTLVAVVWVFMIDRPLIRPIFTKLLLVSGQAETDDGDLTAAVDRLVVRLGVASDALMRGRKRMRRHSKKGSPITKRNLPHGKRNIMNFLPDGSPNLRNAPSRRRIGLRLSRKRCEGKR